MKNIDSFKSKLLKEMNKEIFTEAQVKKDLEREDALLLISNFVKDIKKKFPDKSDRLEILKDTAKTLDFYINEIENTSSFSIGVASYDSDIAPVNGDYDDKNDDDYKSDDWENDNDGDENDTNDDDRILKLLKLNKGEK